jgi:hypothetical protein
MIVGMTGETTKPKRKRWRWIMAGVLLFVAALTGWWNWPRGDARFVGLWINSVSGQPGTASRRFYSDGYTAASGKSLGADGKTLIGRALHNRWRVDGDVLVLTTSYGDGVGGLWRYLKAAFRQRLNTVAAFEERYRILEITSTSLRLQRITDSSIQDSQPIETYLKLGR